MTETPVQVFLDANVIIQAGKPPGGPILSRVIDLVNGGFITILTTDLTKLEVAKKHTENDYAVIKEIGRPHFRKIAKETLGVELPDIDKKAIKDTLFEKHKAGTETMFASLGAQEVPIDSISPSTVFSAYSHETGFFTGEGKKDQFPDAFIFECIKANASKESPVIIVSNDGDFDGPGKNEEHISVLESITDLFTQLGLEVDAPNIESFLTERHDEVLQLVDSELKDWSLQATDVEDAEIDETTVTGIELSRIISFGRIPQGDDILVVGRIEITAEAFYTHPDWDTAMYDSEDKVLIPFEEVSGEAEIKLEADFSMSILTDEGGEPTGIKQLTFRNDSFIWIELHPYDPWDLM